MIPALQNALDKAYEQLPEAIRASISHKEWLWLSDAEKGNLIRSETEPDEP